MSSHRPLSLLILVVTACEGASLVLEASTLRISKDGEANFTLNCTTDEASKSGENSQVQKEIVHVQSMRISKMKNNQWESIVQMDSDMKSPVIRPGLTGDYDLASGFIQVTWPMATNSTAGEYTCDLVGKGVIGQFVSLQSPVVNVDVQFSMTLYDLFKLVKTFSKKFETASADIARNKEAIMKASADIARESAKIARNKEAIEGALANITQNKEVIEKTSGDIMWLKKSFESSSKHIAQNTEAIETASETISQNEEAINMASANITENKETIEMVSADITKNKEAIKMASEIITQNKEAIKMTSADITKNNEAIEIASADITESKDAIMKASVDIIQNKEALENASADITKNKKALEMASADITKNKEALEMVSADITDNKEVLDMASADITKNKEVLEMASADISKNKEVLEMASADITKNKEVLEMASADITKNKEVLDMASADITKNKEAIENASVDINENEQAIKQTKTGQDTLNMMLQQTSNTAENNAATLDQFYRHNFTTSFFERWPQGKYILIEPKSGCPRDTATAERIRSYIQLRVGASGVKISTGAHMIKPDITSVDSKNYINMFFCSVWDSSFVGGLWPPGSYCIGKDHPYACPTGLLIGAIGYGKSDSCRGCVRAVSYCCRNDSLPYTAILLPTRHPFYLYRIGGKCQQVWGMTATEEHLVINTECCGGSYSGLVPDGKKTSSDITLQLCYYDKDTNNG